MNLNRYTHLGLMSLIIGLNVHVCLATPDVTKTKGPGWQSTSTTISETKGDNTTVNYKAITKYKNGSTQILQNTQMFKKNQGFVGDTGVQMPVKDVTTIGTFGPRKSDGSIAGKEQKTTPEGQIISTKCFNKSAKGITTYVPCS